MKTRSVFSHLYVYMQFCAYLKASTHTFGCKGRPDSKLEHSSRILRPSWKDGSKSDGTSQYMHVLRRSAWQACRVPRVVSGHGIYHCGIFEKQDGSVSTCILCYLLRVQVYSSLCWINRRLEYILLWRW